MTTCRHCGQPIRSVAVDDLPVPPSTRTVEGAENFREEIRAEVGDTTWITDHGRFTCPSASYWHQPIAE